MKKSIVIYFLELEDGCYYVGITTDFNRRMDEHWSGEGSMWTKLHKPKKVIEVIYDRECNYYSKALLLEDSKTLEMMKKYGWENVRGGRWCCPHMRWPPKELKISKFSDEDYE